LDGVFGMFTQINQHLKRSQGGLGIGLTLVKRLVELHGGTVAVSSKGEGRGAEFTVRLPLVATAGQRIAAAGRRKPPEDAKRILLIDDNVDGLDMLKMLLSTYGHEV